MGIEKYLTGYRIQEGSADVVLDKDDTSLDAEGWSTVASGKTAEEALKNFLKAINQDEVYTGNYFYRLVLPNDKVVKL